MILNRVFCGEGQMLTPKCRDGITSIQTHNRFRNYHIIDIHIIFCLIGNVLRNIHQQLPPQNSHHNRLQNALLISI